MELARLASSEGRPAEDGHFETVTAYITLPQSGRSALELSDGNAG